jgi:hypothetical protein
MKTAAIYLMIVGAAGLFFAFFYSGPQHAEYAQRSAAYKFGASSRMVIESTLFLLSGFGLIRRRAWARKLALILIPVATVYTTNEFAWGMMHGRPILRVYIISFVLVALSNTIWFYLIFRQSTKDALLPSSSNA